MFDLLASETADFAARVGDQPVNVEAVGTNQVLDEWSHQVHDARLAGRLGQVWLYATVLTIGYMISRGLAKAGSSEPYDENA